VGQNGYTVAAVFASGRVQAGQRASQMEMRRRGTLHQAGAHDNQKKHGRDARTRMQTGTCIRGRGGEMTRGQ